MTASDPDTANIPAATSVGRVALCVHNLDQVVDFYETVVGLEVFSNETERAVLGAGGDPLLELTVDSNAPQRTEDEAGLFHTAFLVPSRAALADTLSRIQERWRLDGASDHLVSEALYLTDPEGNGVEIYCDRPREEWPAEDNGVGMETLPLDLEEFRDLGQNATTVPSETTVGHVHLEVSSLSTSRAFYVDGLGMNVRDRYGDEALFVAAGEYHHHVGLNTWNGRTEPRAGRGLQWFELVVPDEEALDGVRTRFEEGGIDVASVGKGIDVTSTEEGIDVTDPNGIELRLRIEA